MRSSNVALGQNGLTQQYNSLRQDANGGSFLLAHQMLGSFDLSTAPADGDTYTFDINGNNVVFTAKTTLGTTAGQVAIGASATDFAANLIALLRQPQTTTSTGVALAAADQTLISYLSYLLVGTTLIISTNNSSLYAPLTSFSGSTTTSANSWTAKTMALAVEPGVVYVGGTRVIYTGGTTPTVTAPISNPRIDVLAIDDTGTLSWTTGTEAASPSAPTYPANKVAICELYNVVGEIALYDNDNLTSGDGYISNDVRPMLGTAFDPLSVSSDILPDADGTRNLGSSTDQWDNIYAKSGIYLNGSAFGNQLTFAATALESISAGAPVAAALSQSTDIGYDTSGVTTGTGSVTIGSNSNRVLLVIAFGTGATSGSPVISGTFASQPITFTSNHYLQSSNSFSAAVGYLIAPNVGSGSFSLASSGGSISQVFYISLYNADQTSPLDSSAFNFSSTGSSPFSVTDTLATDGAIAFGAIYCDGGTTDLSSPSGNIYTDNTGINSNQPSYAYGNAGVTNIYGSGSTMDITAAFSNLAVTLGAIGAVKPYNAVTHGVQNASSASAAYPNTRCTGFMGFAVTSQTSGQAVTVATAGVASGFSGLTTGVEYYLNDTNGTIGHSAGSVSRKVGVAISSTELRIANGW